MKPPNYVKALTDSGIAKPGAVTGAIVLHIERCSHWRGLPCDCAPVVKPCDPAQVLRLNQKPGAKN